MGVTYSVGNESEWNEVAATGINPEDCILVTNDFTFTTNPPDPIVLGYAAFYGNGHTITLAASEEPFWGLVTLGGGTVRDVTVDATPAVIAEGSAALVRAGCFGNIYGCRVVASLTNPWSACIAGIHFGENGNGIYGCHAQVVSCSGENCAGIASGYRGVYIQYCTVSGASDGDYFAGIVSFDELDEFTYARTVKDCFSSVDVGEIVGSGGIVNVDTQYPVLLDRCASVSSIVGRVRCKTDSNLVLENCYCIGGSVVSLAVFTQAGASQIYISKCYLAADRPWIQRASDASIEDPEGQVSVQIEHSFRAGETDDIIGTDPTNERFSVIQFDVGTSLDNLQAALGLLDGAQWDSAVWAVSADDNATMILRTFRNIDPETGELRADGAEFRDDLFGGVYENFDDIPTLNGKAHVRVADIGIRPYAPTDDMFDEDHGAEQLMSITGRVTITVEMIANTDADVDLTTCLTATSGDPSILTISSVGVATRGTADTVEFVANAVGSGTVQITFTPTGQVARAFDMRPSVLTVTADAVPCFAGWMPVQMAQASVVCRVRDLQPGQLIRDSKGVVHRVCRVTRSTAREITTIAPGALGSGKPLHALTLTPNHMVYHPLGFWVTADQVGRNTAVPDGVPVYHICLETWTDLLIAGVRVETCAWKPEHHQVRPAVRQRQRKQ